ncbi:Transient receptor potential cation channel protein painless [Gryllus bimaculatus]|nr:Transient receptor potential cation channel protein painless [Gryllus bimaculatus]
MWGAAGLCCSVRQVLLDCAHRHHAAMNFLVVDPIPEAPSLPPAPAALEAAASDLEAAVLAAMRAGDARGFARPYDRATAPSPRAAAAARRGGRSWAARRTALHHAVVPRREDCLERARACVLMLLGQARPEEWASAGRDPDGGDWGSCIYGHGGGGGGGGTALVDVDAADTYQCTALHYAARYADERMVLTLLRCGAFMGVRDRFGHTALKDINASTLETHLDECLRSKNAKSPQEYMYSMIFTYTFLPTSPAHISEQCRKAGIGDPESCTSSLKTCVYTSEMHVLEELSHMRCTRHLLKHPVVTLFLNMKWHKIKYIFYCNILTYTIFLISLNYYIIMRPSVGCNKFNKTDPWRAIFKTVIMMAGEFDAVDLPLSTFPVTSHIIFIVFVFLISIVLLNLLNGLAVSDTQAIKEEAEVFSLVARVRTISQIENSLLHLRNSTLLKTFLKLKCIRHVYHRIFIFPFFYNSKEIRVYPNWKENNVVISRPDDSNEYFHMCNWSFKRSVDGAIKVVINRRKGAGALCVKMTRLRNELRASMEAMERRLLGAMDGKARRGTRLSRRSCASYKSVAQLQYGYNFNSHSKTLGYIGFGIQISVSDIEILNYLECEFQQLCPVQMPAALARKQIGPVLAPRPQQHPEHGASEAGCGAGAGGGGGGGGAGPGRMFKLWRLIAVGILEKDDEKNVSKEDNKKNNEKEEEEKVEGENDDQELEKEIQIMKELKVVEMEEVEM